MNKDITEDPDNLEGLDEKDMKKSKIRTSLNEEEYLVDIKMGEAIFLGELVGIMLTKRDRNDPHVMFQIMIEDDGGWFPYDQSGSSSSSRTVS